MPLAAPGIVTIIFRTVNDVEMMRPYWCLRFLCINQNIGTALDRLENNGVRGSPSVSIRKAVAETFNGKFTLNFMMKLEAFGQCKAVH